MTIFTDIPLPKKMPKNIGNAWRKGYAAFLTDRTTKQCPYTCSRMAYAYYSAWNKGWESAKDNATLTV